MNCQDISRIADSGNFSMLTDGERREAEAHARTCRSCAAVWAVHAALAAQRIPPMPAELMAQVRTAAALPARTRGNPALRRLTLLGGALALAAAAAWLVMHQAGTAAPASKPPVVSTTPAVVPAPAPVIQKAELPLPGRAAPATSTAVDKIKSENVLPLLLPPDFSAPERVINLAIQKAADVHPELVEGPDIDGRFSGTIVIRANGTLVSSDIHLVAAQPSSGDVDTRPAMRTPVEEPRLSLPLVSSGTDAYREKHTVLPDGRKLRADLWLQFGVIPDTTDITRSSNRVLEIVRKQHADLLLPISGEELNQLTLFLAEDGSIQREEVVHVNRPTPSLSPLPLSPPPLPSKENGPARDASMAQLVAEGIARRLALDINQIGLMGFTTLEDGKAIVVSDGTGNLRPKDNRRVLSVTYAWPRRAGETAPFLEGAGAANGPTTLRPRFDEAAAAAILKHEIPDAFTNKDPAAGLPGMFFTYKGELIRAGRLRAPDGGMPDQFVLVRQLAPGVQMGPGLGRDIKDETGARVNVVFAWEKAPAAPAPK